MLVWLAPSESKSAPAHGAPYDPRALSRPSLAQARATLLERLEEASASPDAAALLGLGPASAHEAETNARIRSAPAAPAGELFSGVLYGALDLASLDAARLEVARRTTAVFSGLFGVLALEDRVPEHRLSMGAKLPGMPGLPAFWRPRLDAALREEGAGKCVVDARSGPYSRACPAPWAQVVAIEAVREAGGRRTRISHDAKRWRGLACRELYSLPAGADEDAVLHALASLPGRIESCDAKGGLHRVLEVEISQAAPTRDGGTRRTATLVTD